MYVFEERKIKEGRKEGRKGEGKNRYIIEGCEKEKK